MRPIYIPEFQKTKKSKYGNKKVVIDGYRFDSEMEGNRYIFLRRLERAGAIRDLRRQVAYELYRTHKIDGVTIRGSKYIADFVYTQNGKTVVEDVKGFRTREYKRKKRMLKERYGIEITEVSK